MDALEKALNNVLAMSKERLSHDAPALQSAMRKIELVQRGFRRFELSKEDALKLSVEFNSSVRQVKANQLEPIKSVLDVINSSKAKLLELRSSAPPASSQNLANDPLSARPSHVFIQMPEIPTNDESSITTKSSAPEIPVDDEAPRKKRIRTTLVIHSDVSSEASHSNSEITSSSSNTGDRDWRDVEIVGSSDLETPGTSTQSKAATEEERKFGVAASIASSSSGITTDDSRPRRQAALRAASLSEMKRQKISEQKNKRNIERLEKHLKKLSDAIAAKQGEELSLDDMDKPDSAYVIGDKLEKKFMQVLKYISARKGCKNVLLGRPTDKLLRFDKNPHPEVNEEINRLLKKRVFPDYIDIHNCVSRANINHNLGLTQMTVNEYAKSAFIKIGEHIKLQRRRDYRQNFGSTYTDQCNPSNDPAYYDPDLNEKLKKSKEKGDQEMDQLLDKFSRQQEDERVDDESEGRDDNDEDNEDIDDVDEEEEEEDEVEEDEILDVDEGEEEKTGDEELSEKDQKSGEEDQKSGEEELGDKNLNSTLVPNNKDDSDAVESEAVQTCMPQIAAVVVADNIGEVSTSESHSKLGDGDETSGQSGVGETMPVETEKPTDESNVKVVETAGVISERPPGECMPQPELVENATVDSDETPHLSSGSSKVAAGMA